MVNVAAVDVLQTSLEEILMEHILACQKKKTYVTRGSNSLTEKYGPENRTRLKKNLNPIANISNKDLKV